MIRKKYSFRREKGYNSKKVSHLLAQTSCEEGLLKFNKKNLYFPTNGQ